MAENPTTETVDRLLYSVSDAATALGVSKWTVYKLLDSGELRGVYQKSRRYVHRDEIGRYVAALSRTPEAS